MLGIFFLQAETKSKTQKLTQALNTAIEEAVLENKQNYKRIPVL